MRNIKRFEDFLDRMQGLLDNAKEQGQLIVRVEDLENTFPELKESEDERIRKAILNYFTKCWGNCKDDVCGIHVEDVIAWLENQGEQKPIDYNKELKKCRENPLYFFVKYVKPKLKEQKSAWGEEIEKQEEPADKVEPKFKVGDTMRIDNEYYHRTNELIAIKDQDDYEYPPMNRKHNAWSEDDIKVK